MEDIPHIVDALGEALESYRDAVRDAAEKERLYRLERAKAFINHSNVPTVKQRELMVEHDTIDAKYERDLAEGYAQAELERLRTLRQILSAAQTVANLPID